MEPAAGRDVSGDKSAPDAGFVGQILKRASPILTWRPAKVDRITMTPKEPARGTRGKKTDSLIHRISRLPTRRVVAWPVIRRVERAREGALRALLVRVVAGAMVASLIVASGYWGFEQWGRTQAAPVVATRTVLAHVIEEDIDTLALQDTPVATTPAHPAATASAHPVSHAADAHHGRARHGHRHQALASNR